jgi:hypothetical protein
MQISVSRDPPHSSTQAPQAAAPKPRLLDQARLALRARYYVKKIHARRPGYPTGPMQ